MKHILMSLIAAVATVTAAEPDVKIDHLKTKSGKEYTKVTITARRADGISIMHESGTTRIKFEDLPDDLAKRLGGFDPEVAKIARAKAEAVEAAAMAEMDSAEAAQANASNSKADRKAIIASSRPAVLKVVQATPEGVLCHIAWFQDSKIAVTSKDSFGRNQTSYKTAAGLGQFSDQMHFVTGIADAVDGEQLGAALVAEGIHRYTTVSGAESSVNKWRAINGAVKANASDVDGSDPSRRTIPRRPSSWLRSVGGG